MGITIKNEAVGMPLIAAYATGVGRAQDRQKNRATAMVMQQENQKREDARNAALIKARQDENNARRLDDIAGRDAEHKFRLDEIGRRGEAERTGRLEGSLYDGIASREKWLLNTPLNDVGMKQRDEAVKSLEWIRRQQGSVRPDVYNQYISQWMREFDSRNPQAWEAPPKSSTEGYVYRGVDGRVISPEDAESGRVPIGSYTPPSVNGVAQRPVEVKRRGGSFEDFYGDRQDQYWKDYEKSAAELGNTKDGPSKDQNAITKRMRERYDTWRQSTGAAPPQQGAPTGGAAGIPAQPGTPVPTEPGRGQQLPVPTQPFQPPTQPLGVGSVTLPGGPSKLADPPAPPKTLEEMLGEQQARQGQPGGAVVDDPGLRTGPDGRPVDKDGNPIQYKIDDGVQYFDSQGRPLDSEGYPVVWVNDGNGNFTPRRTSNTPTGKASSTIIEPDARTDTMPAPGSAGDLTLPGGTGQPGQPQVSGVAPWDMKVSFEKAKARSPEKAKMYDDALELLRRASTGAALSEEELASLWTAGLEADGAGLGMKE